MFFPHRKAMMDCRRVIAIALKLTWESFPSLPLSPQGQQLSRFPSQGWIWRKHLEFAEDYLFFSQWEIHYLGTTTSEIQREYVRKSLGVPYANPRNSRLSMGTSHDFLRSNAFSYDWTWCDQLQCCHQCLWKGWAMGDLGWKRANEFSPLSQLWPWLLVITTLKCSLFGLYIL